MTASCPFCTVVESNADWILYKDETVVAFLDHHPIRPGHALVAPRMHEPDFFALSEKISSAIMNIAKRLAAAQVAAFRPKRVGMLVAGFDIAHAHLHVIPMHDYHDITSKPLLEGKLVKASPSDLKHNASNLRQYLTKDA
jgi:histidine triad (HIT) family protein